MSEDYLDKKCGKCSEYCSYAENKCLLNHCFVSEAMYACRHFEPKEDFGDMCIYIDKKDNK